MSRGRLSIRFAYRDPKGKPEKPPGKPDRPGKPLSLDAGTGAYVSTGSLIGAAPIEPIEPPVVGKAYALAASTGFYFTTVARSFSEEN